MYMYIYIDMYIDNNLWGFTRTYVWHLGPNSWKAGISWKTPLAHVEAHHCRYSPPGSRSVLVFVGGRPKKEKLDADKDWPH